MMTAFLIGWLLLTSGVAMWGLSKLLELFRPR